MFVRHPMERLVSCYYDKMMINPHKSLRAFRRAVKMRARKIMARSRSQLSSSEASTDSKEMFRKKRSVTSSKNEEDLNGEIRTKILGTFKVGILLKKKVLENAVTFEFAIWQRRPLLS